MQTSHYSYCQTYLFLDKLTSILISVTLNYLEEKNELCYQPQLPSSGCELFLLTMSTLNFLEELTLL